MWGHACFYIITYCSILYLTQKLIPIFIQTENLMYSTNRLIEIDDQNKMEYKKGMITMHLISFLIKLTQT